MVDYPGAFPMFVARNRVFIESNRPRWLVIHKTAGLHSARDVAAFFATDPREASTHYVVGQDGAVVQCVREADGAGGNCCLEAGHAPYLPTNINLNLRTISIEHVDPATDNSTPLTEAQKRASFELVGNICARQGIPLRRGDADGGIIGHRDIAPQSRARCPGNFSWDELFTFLAQGEQNMLDLKRPEVQAFFTLQADGSLKCKRTGSVIWRGILAFYRRFGGDALFGLTYLGLPLTDELGVAGKAGCVTQRFERGLVAYDPQHQLDDPPGSGNVYLMHVQS